MPGGSSGGSAAAVSARQSMVSLGSEIHHTSVNHSLPVSDHSVSTRNLNFRFTSRILLFNFGSTFELYEFLEDVAGHVGLDWIRDLHFDQSEICCFV